MIEKKLLSLRKIVLDRKSSVTRQLIQNHYAEICIICGDTRDLTKEHVIPKWVFKNDQKRTFIQTLNDVSQTYSKTTVFACKYCNNELLSSLETYIQQLFNSVDLSEVFFDDNQLDKLILWLEVIDYKLQILDLRRKFNKSPKGPYIPYLANIPVAILQRDVSPTWIFRGLSKAYKRLGVKKKNFKESLLVFKTTNPDFHFFNRNHDFIFLELPEYEKAFFLFLRERFEQHTDAHDKAMKIMKEVY